MHRFEKLNNLSVNIYELNFYQDGDKWKHNLIPIEISKNESDRVVDVMIYKNHSALMKKLHVILGDHHKKHFRKFADVEPDNEIVGSSLVNKTKNNYKQKSCTYWLFYHIRIGRCFRKWLL